MRFCCNGMAWPTWIEGRFPAYRVSGRQWIAPSFGLQVEIERFEE